MGCNVRCPFIGREFDDNWGLEDPTGKTDEEFIKVMKEIETKIMQLKVNLCSESDSKVEKAAAYFENGFNCSQAVFTTFATDYGMSEDLALKVATQFGGGARKGEMCGAVAGALMVLGLVEGHCHIDAPEEKAHAYKRAEEFMDSFIEKNGTVVCRELLGYDITKQEDKVKINELGLFKTICPKMIKCATEIVEQMLKDTSKG